MTVHAAQASGVLHTCSLLSDGVPIFLRHTFTNMEEEQRSLAA